MKLLLRKIFNFKKSKAKVVYPDEEQLKELYLKLEFLVRLTGYYLIVFKHTAALNGGWDRYIQTNKIKVKQEFLDILNSDDEWRKIFSLSCPLKIEKMDDVLNIKKMFNWYLNELACVSSKLSPDLFPRTVSHGESIKFWYTSTMINYFMLSNGKFLGFFSYTSVIREQLLKMMLVLAEELNLNERTNTRKKK